MTTTVIFRVAGVPYAFPRAQTEQVLSDVRVTRVPLALSAFDGVVYMRSRLVPVLHVRKRLGLPPAGGADNVVLVRYEGEWIGLRVDAVEDAGDGEEPAPLDLARLLAHGAPLGTEVVVPLGMREV